MSSPGSAGIPLDRIEATAKSQADGSGHVWDVLARDVLALVAVARAAEHLVAYDDAVKEWDAIDALADPRAKQEASDRAHELLTRAIDGAREALARLGKATA